MPSTYMQICRISNLASTIAVRRNISNNCIGLQRTRIVILSPNSIFLATSMPIPSEMAGCNARDAYILHLQIGWMQTSQHSRHGPPVIWLIGHWRGWCTTIRRSSRMCFNRVFLSHSNLFTDYANSNFNDTMILCSHSVHCMADWPGIVCGTILYERMHRLRCGPFVQPNAAKLPYANKTIKFNYFSITFIKLDLFIYIWWSVSVCVCALSSIFLSVAIVCIKCVSAIRSDFHSIQW